MKQTRIVADRCLLLLLVAFCAWGCVYQTPLTPQPTRKIDDRLLGDWLEKDKDGKTMKIRELTDSQYIIDYDGLYRAFHSDLGNNHFVSVQDLNPLKDEDRKYSIVTYEIRDDGNTLVVRAINTDVIPATLTTQTALRKAIEANLTNPKLFDPDAGTYTRVQNQ